MLGRIVEVAQDQRHLSLARGFMQVEDSSTHTLLGQIPLDDIAAVIANAHGLSYTNNLLVALAERGAPFVLCAANHNAVGMLLSLDGNFEQGRRFDAQIAATSPLTKRLWAEIVKAKLQQQAGLLQALQLAHLPIASLVRKVRTGDPENIEAQAARKYWSTLFGAEFRRDHSAEGINALLNYGYTVLRAATARAVVAAGLHPTLGLHHCNQNNPMRLVDDLMEPFRPVIDATVWHLQRQGETTVNPTSKKALVQSLYTDMPSTSGITPVMVCLQKLAISLAQVFVGEKERLELPLPGLALNLAAPI